MSGYAIEDTESASTDNITYITEWPTNGVLVFPSDQEMILWEELKGGFGNILPVNRYSAVSSTRIEQVARYGDSVALDIFVEQMRLDSDPVILKSIADNLATMELRNKVAQNRGGGTLVCGSPNEVGPDPTLDDYFDVRAFVFVFYQFLRNSAV